MAVTKDTQIGAKFEQKIVSEIDKYAALHEMDRSKVIRLAVKQFLGLTPSNQPSQKGKLSKVG
ncbi:ribbon-helix-helix protein, CopG family [Leptospira ryugenii]|uniref:Ribbon-helix-helix protein, CopG family n=1 Tax=Leptospira ryugenii TaxID=1917863 RepID=A0A2P2DXL7_9LEPT|nr:hypothetical protein [Leptospira ryugenii]GBF49383.1 ribbon-helix-helix protein, CopG family [Leptospira ryugenii]